MKTAYIANSILTISYLKVEKVVGSRLYKKFADAVDSCPMPQSELFSDDFNLDYYDVEDETSKAVSKVMDLYNQVVKAFYKATKMTITRGYHEVEDRKLFLNDDVDGGYWEVDFSSVYTMTKKAKDFEATFGCIDTSHFVTKSF